MSLLALSPTITPAHLGELWADVVGALVDRLARGRTRVRVGTGLAVSTRCGSEIVDAMGSPFGTDVVGKKA